MLSYKIIENSLFLNWFTGNQSMKCTLLHPCGQGICNLTVKRHEAVLCPSYDRATYNLRRVCGTVYTWSPHEIALHGVLCFGRIIQTCVILTQNMNR